MNIDMYLDEAIKQSSNVNDMNESLITTYNRLEENLHQFLSENNLKGKSYDAAKNLVSEVVIPLLKAIVILSGHIKRENSEYVRSYQTEVANESLQSSVLEMHINQLSRHLSELYDIENKVSMLPNVSVALNSSLLMMIESLKTQKRILEDKLEKLIHFNDISVNFFDESESFKALVLNGLSQLKNSWNVKENMYVVPSKSELSWTKKSKR
ncbi:T7SS effector LXG polymorphic toxin [Macrococcus armenti]|uniref:T7SS effector LXG polymorphic toxin n=1 Tax=Macrococcus armenti TaxID=2875764 RepID=UPI001CCA2148|nr:T7SS effector LXG polymorphic toxin [Macrococcus armenti]UBH15627.1 LXG domain-containing protein [Macrococcus armenti]UBH17988.1 LXG domain-containing protein [Macrococcus armenti]UBH20253.1 LXG domain-containing protein [Macrococcus armenti]